MLYPYPGSCGTYRSSRSSAYEYERLTEVPEVPGAGMKVLKNFQKFRVLWHGRAEVTDVPTGTRMMYPYPGSLWYCTELTDVPGTGMISYRTYRSSL